MTDILISYIVTVYNKEPYIGYTAASLLQQEGGFASEYIFVDDVSGDRSLEVIEDVTKNVPNVAIVRNSANAGPSVRVNQGARMARGKYLQFIDSDDMLAVNASAVMLKLMQEHNADLVHGGWDKTGEPSASLIGRRVREDAPYRISDKPLEFVFAERMRRMAQMVRRDVFLRAGGCDEGVFVQDESLSLRLARTARRVIRLEAPILLIPYVEGELSRNIGQCNHDRFLACRNMLRDFPDLDDKTRRRLYRRCISAVWKQECHRQGTLRAAFGRSFWRYMRSQLTLLPVDKKDLDAMSAYFAQVPGVRRMENGHG